MGRAWDGSRLGRRRRRFAFTYLELIIALVILAILTVSALPDPEAKAESEGDAAALRFESDVDYVRARSIARPDDPLVIKVDVAQNRYWVARKAAPDTPIAHPSSGKAYVVKFGNGGDPGLNNVKLTGCDFGVDPILAFDAVGSTNRDQASCLYLSAGSETFQIEVSADAARVKNTRGVAAPSG